MSKRHKNTETAPEAVVTAPVQQAAEPAVVVVIIETEAQKEASAEPAPARQPKPRSKAHHKPKPQTFIEKGPDPIQPESRFDAQGNHVTTYSDGHGASIQVTDKGNRHEQYDILLADKSGTLHTYSSHRGFGAQSADAKGREYTQLAVIPGDADRLHCDVGNRRIIPDVTESVTRDKLEQFFGETKDGKLTKHADLAAALIKSGIPVTVANGLPVSLDEALAMPTNFRACPAERRGEGIVVEKKATAR